MGLAGVARAHVCMSVMNVTCVHACQHMCMCATACVQWWGKSLMATITRRYFQTNEQSRQPHEYNGIYYRMIYSHGKFGSDRAPTQAVLCRLSQLKSPCYCTFFFYIAQLGH